MTEWKPWTQFDGAGIHAAVGVKGIWVTNAIGGVYVRSATDFSSGWSHVDGSLKQIEVGPQGAVYGFNATTILHRAGRTIV